MVSLNNNLHTALVGNDSILPKATSKASTTSATDSFTAQLAKEIEGFLAQSGNGSHFEIDIEKGSVTVKTLDVAPTLAPAPATTAAAATTSLVAGISSPVTGVSLMDAKPRGALEIAAVSTPAAVSIAAPVVDKSNMKPADAYWAEQPEEVQVLRDMPESDRQLAATDLAKKGYTIDVPIMVWGWDPLTTMVERQNYGYTWTPSALQAPVQLPPGLSFPGLPTYDAANAPPGSIKVSTEFAEGTNMQNAFIDPAAILASMATSIANSISIQAALKVPISS